MTLSYHRSHEQPERAGRAAPRRRGPKRRRRHPVRAGAAEAREAGKTGDTAEPRVPVDATLSFRDAKQQAVQHVERFYITELMRLCDGNVNRAAEIAQIDRASFYRKLRKLGIKASATR